MDISISQNLLSALLVWVFEYIPGVSAWYEGLATANKRLVMAVLLLLLASVPYVLSCTGVTDSELCNTQSIWELFQQIFSMVAINQGVHKLTKKS